MYKLLLQIFIVILLVILTFIPFETLSESVEINSDEPEELVAEEVTITDDEFISITAKEFGVSESLARSIMFCESSNRPHVTQHNRRDDGSIWSTDYGYWQINDYYHKEVMMKMGLDILNPKDNIYYGFYLLSRQGTQPWGASKHCWDR